MDDATMITENWLKENGFKWFEMERSQPHWILWLGNAIAENRAHGRTSSNDDFGIELSKFTKDTEVYGCFLRADYAGRFTRFIFCRDIWEPEHITQLIEAFTGFPYSKDNVYYGFYYRPEQAAHLRELDTERLDRRIAFENKWRDDEKDNTKAVRK